MSKKESVEENTNSIENFDLPPLGTVNDLPDDPQPQKPLPHEPEWQSYVLDMLTSDEVVYDNKGNQRPRAVGLARVFEIVMGPIIYGKAKVFACGPERAVIEYELAFYKEMEGRGNGETIIIQEVSEINSQNCKPPFVHYAVPSAATIAEGRAYKKALKLKVYTAEEISPEMDNPRNSNMKADEGQLNAINLMINRCKINKEKYLNKLNTHFKENWKEFEDFSYDAAHKVMQSLNSYFRKEKSIPEDIL